MRDSKKIYMFTDGSCENNQSDNNIGGWGTILKYGDNIKKMKARAVNTTNNKMELTAVIKGLEAIKDRNIPIWIFTDSAYIVNCFEQKWYVNWIKNGWKNSAKKPVENKELWENLINLYKLHTNIKIIKIKGHINPNNDVEIMKWYKKLMSDYNIQINYEEYKEAIIYNNMADELATKK